MERTECRSVDDLVPVKKPRLSDSTSTILQLDASQKHEASGAVSSNSNISVPTTSHCSNVPLNVKQCKSDKVPEQHEDENSDDSDSEASESDWQPSTNGAMEWVHSQMLAGAEPREILSKLVPDVTSIPPNVNMWSIWKLIINLLSEPKRRKKLSDVNTLADAVHLIRTSKKILVLTGAGVSVSCGIPDFRSRDGIYARLSVDFPDLPNPQAMFDIHYFKRDPRPFFKFAKEIYPGQFKPSKAHRFIKLLEKSDRLLRNYTQNIDTLEQVAGISKVVQCHGSFATASCCSCNYKTNCEELREDIFKQVVPLCPQCTEEKGILKPDIVFFGENLPEHFHRQMTKDKDDADLLIVIGSSLKVRPVALIPNSIPSHIPQILINREPLLHMTFDVELLGDCDVILSHICSQLQEDFTDLTNGMERLRETTTLPTATDNLRPSDTPLENGKSYRNDQPPQPTIGVTPSSASSPTCDKPPNQEPTAHVRGSGDSEKNPNGVSFSKLEVEKDKNEMSKNAEILPDKQIELSNKVENASAGTKNLSENVKDVSESEEKCLQSMKGVWKSRWKPTISRNLQPGTFYYNGEHRYIFHGAEIRPEEDSESEDSSDFEDSSDQGEISPTSQPNSTPSIEDDSADVTNIQSTSGTNLHVDPQNG